MCRTLRDKIASRLEIKITEEKMISSHSSPKHQKREVNSIASKPNSKLCILDENIVEEFCQHHTLEDRLSYWFKCLGPAHTIFCAWRDRDVMFLVKLFRMTIRISLSRTPIRPPKMFLLKAKVIENEVLLAQHLHKVVDIIKIHVFAQDFKTLSLKHLGKLDDSALRPRK